MAIETDNAAISLQPTRSTLSMREKVEQRHIIVAHQPVGNGILRGWSAPVRDRRQRSPCDDARPAHGIPHVTDRWNEQDWRSLQRSGNTFLDAVDPQRWEARLEMAMRATSSVETGKERQDKADQQGGYR